MPNQHNARVVHWWSIPAIVAVIGCGSLPPDVGKARRQLARGDYQSAETTAATALTRYPKHPLLWRVRMQAAMGDHDNARAAKLYAQWYQLRDRLHDRATLRVMALTMMWQGLRVPSASVRTRAIQAVERLELDDLAQEVSKLITNDDDRVAAAAAIALLKADRAAPKVATDALRSDDARARVIAVEGIGRKVGAAARDDLVPRLRDKDPMVRRAAVTAIGNFGADKDTVRLIGVAISDQDGSVRATALRALRKGKRRNLLEVARSGLVDRYLGARLAAVELLGRLKPFPREQLLGLAAGRDLFVALRALAVLGKRAHDGAAVTRALRDPSWEVRVAAINALSGPAFTKAAGDRALPLLDDTRVEVRIAAARVLLGTGHRTRAVATLARALAEPDDSVRLQAARNLIAANDPRGLQMVVSLLKSASPATRAAAISAHLQARTVTLGLVEALADESPELRIRAAEALLTI